MNRLRLAYVFLCGVCVCACAKAQTNMEVTVWTGTTSLSGNSNDVQFNYVFARDQLLNARTWNYRTEEFPLDFEAEARRARGLLVRQQPSLQATLPMIVIRRVSSARKALGITGDPGDLTNRWFIVFDFMAQLPVASSTPVNRPVVSLLDGSYATERPQPLEPPPGDVKSDTNGLFYIKHDIGHDQAYAPDGDPLSELHVREFQIPRVQWDPLSQPFLLNVRSNALAAEARIRSELPVSDEPLGLVDIVLMSYMPDTAIAANHLSPIGNFHHWVLCFRFRQELAQPDEYYWSCVLLDGRFLRSSRNRVPLSITFLEEP